MESLVSHYLNRKMITFEDVAGKGAKQITFNKVDIEKAAHYAAEDADETLQLHEHFWPAIAVDADLKKLFSEIEMPLITVLARMENWGVLIDSELLKNHSQELGKTIEGLEHEIYGMAGEELSAEILLESSLLGDGAHGDLADRMIISRIGFAGISA